MSVSQFRLDSPPATPTPLAVGPAGHRGLTTTVPKEYVHRAAVAEVMLTGWARLDETRFLVHGQWPRSHVFFTPGADGAHDPTIAAETIRQAGLLLCHAELGVPLDYRFLMHDLRFHVHPDRLAVGDRPASLEIEVRCTEVRRRAGTVYKLAYEATVLRDGALAATGGATTSTVSPRVYERMRDAGTRGTPGLPTPAGTAADPRAVGRSRADDVVLSPGDAPNRWLLRVDPRHPVLFDHPVDHVPGMALIEAARQAAVAAAGGPAARILGMTVRFDRYAELDAPCVIEACVPPETVTRTQARVLVTGRQRGERVFAATVAAGGGGLG